MKNKKTAYYLIPVVLLLWGYIGYKIFNGLSSDDDTVHYNSVVKTVLVDDSVVYEKPILLFTYSDPFLDRSVLENAKERKSEAISNRTKSTRNKKAVKRVRNINWSFVQYNGNIKAKNDKVALLVINKKNSILKVGEEMNEVFVQAIYDDSVRVKYHEQEKTILKH